MSYDTWDKAIAAAGTAGGELGRTIAAWQDVPQRDADQLINEATDAFKDAATDALRQAAEPTADVPMVCTSCRKPVIRSGDSDWIHRDQDDIYACTRVTGRPVTAMVAAGNENVPQDSTEEV